jgi:hypothetical protein
MFLQKKNIEIKNQDGAKKTMKKYKINKSTGLSLFLKKYLKEKILNS